MKRLLLIALIVATTAGRAEAIPPDKLTHFAVSFPWGALGTVVADQFVPEYRLVAGALLGTVPGLCVEIGDSTTKSGFSGGDLLADFIGSSLGALFTDQVVLRFFFDKQGDDRVAGAEVAGTF